MALGSFLICALNSPFTLFLLLSLSCAFSLQLPRRIACSSFGTCFFLTRIPGIVGCALGWKITLASTEDVYRYARRKKCGLAEQSCALCVNDSCLARSSQRPATTFSSPFHHVFTLLIIPRQQEISRHRLQNGHADLDCIPLLSAMLTLSRPPKLFSWRSRLRNTCLVSYFPRNWRSYISVQFKQV